MSWICIRGWCQLTLWSSHGSRGPERAVGSCRARVIDHPSGLLQRNRRTTMTSAPLAAAQHQTQANVMIIQQSHSWIFNRWPPDNLIAKLMNIQHSNRNLKFWERHSKAKRRAGTYSRALWYIKGVVQRVVHGKLRSDFQRVRGDRVAVKVGVV